MACPCFIGFVSIGIKGDVRDSILPAKKFVFSEMSFHHAESISTRMLTPRQLALLILPHPEIVLPESRGYNVWLMAILLKEYPLLHFAAPPRIDW